MDKDPITIREIEQYLAGELSPDRQADFENRLRDDEEATREILQLKQIIEGLQGYAFRQKLKEFHQRNFPGIDRDSAD